MASWLKWVGVPIAAGAIGAGLGWGIQALMEVDVHFRPTLIGSVVGAVAGVAYLFVELWRRRVNLAEVTVTVPQFSTLKFVVRSEDRRVAWELFVEAMTRIATQPLRKDEGNLREALDSLHGLFSTTRTLLRGMPPSPATQGETVEMLTIRLLNRELRPFLSRWHPLLSKHEATEEEAWAEESACREELEQVRLSILAYARAFGELAGVQQLDQFFQEEQALRHLSGKAEAVEAEPQEGDG